MESTERFNDLLHKYTTRTCNWEEYQELFSYLRKEENKELLFQFMNEKYIMDEPGSFKTDEEWDAVYENMVIDLHKSRKSFPWARFMVAAVLVILGATAILWSDDPRPVEQVSKVHVFKNDIAPGTNKALLTLADGSVIGLNNDDNKIISKNGDTFITKAQDGQLVYEAHAAANNLTDQFNVLTTPRGGQYAVLLPDGSKVWLNAASSLKYPTAFNGDSRNVTLTGEAYFEIAKDKAHPFIVRTEDAEVRVLGTHFNIKAYAEENKNETTLLEGAIQFSRSNRQYLLKPGQQVNYRPGTSREKIVTPDLESIMAWRNGVFVFDDTEIDEIMRTIKRWYNVDVIYKGAKPELSFTGVIPRTTNISKVLRILESAGDIVFDVDGNKIICSKSK